MYVAQDRNEVRDVVNSVTNIRDANRRNIFLYLDAVNQSASHFSKELLAVCRLYCDFGLHCCDEIDISLCQLFCMV